MVGAALFASVRWGAAIPGPSSDENPRARPPPCCAQAIVSVLLNAAGRPGLELGPELTALKDFTATFTPDMTGLAIGNSDTIRALPHQPSVGSKRAQRKRCLAPAVANQSGVS